MVLNNNRSKNNDYNAKNMEFCLQSRKGLLFISGAKEKMKVEYIKHRGKLMIKMQGHDKNAL